ncbi:MAG: Non-specific serine/threonine protein kinase [Nocardia sp.]|uniref:AfsR/SARP family transcriptional regulator n=1 Tax=Nocardia sp. TaxID=1821 RepID=UPI00262D8BDA|nr:BTAD domain-containing putative transcriptional regulator [Nocardia sp.]MCU1640362.1 Non-specific serine/threonine protein kinase [Nocardia sp.]
MFSQTGSSSSAGSTRPVSAGDTVLVALLGEVALRRGGAQIAAPGSAPGALAPVPGARARLLVAALATHPGRSRSAQALIEDVWGEEPPRAPMNALHTQVSRLRSALPEGALEIGPAGYRLVLAPDQVDLALAQHLETQARQAHSAGDGPGCLALIAAARTLWRGDPSADLPSGPVADELAGLAAARRQALDALELSVREAVGDLPGALELARGAAAAEPFDEPAHATLMRLLAAAGRTNEALDVFASLRTRLVDQLGADPGPVLVALNTALLRGEALPGARTAPNSTAGPNYPPGQGHSGSDNHLVGTGSAAGSGYPAGPRPSGGANYAFGSGGGPGQGYSDEDSARFEGGESGRRWTGSGAGQSVSGAGESGGRWGSAQALRMVSAAQHAAGAEYEPAGSAIGLRAAPNPLLGREADIDALERLLRTSRVTTVLGPGGTGKTRVANELGARVANERTVALIELASLRADPEGDAETRVEIEATIAATLGVGEFSRDTNVLRTVRNRDLRQRLREALSSGPMLLILDNCEHLIDAVAEMVADFVGASDQLTVLTTSRAPLEITAEAVYPLPPLLIDVQGSPATDLFTARARAVRPTVRLDPEVVARLCRMLDGLPLAIELAAARTRTMSVEEIESRLDHRFALLRSGDRSSPQRHRTLHAVIEWSWNLLDGEQRTALRRLCRFPGGFTLSAAERVISGPEILDAATAIDGLVGQSLLTVLESDDAEYDVTRYRMLETVREFGEEQLVATGEADLVMARMSDWAREFALDVATRYSGDDQLSVVLGVGAELENLVAVLRHAVDRRDLATVHAVYPVLAMLWIMRGAHLEFVSWLPRILATPVRLGPLNSAEADLQIFGQIMAGLHVMFMGTGPRSAAVVRTRIRRLVRDGAAMSPVFRFLGELVTVPSNSWQLARKLGDGVRSMDPPTRVAALLVRANIRENSGDVYGSMRDAVQALASGIAEDLWGMAMVCQHLGGMYGQSARYGEAVDYYRQAADLLVRLRAYDESMEIRSLLACSLVGIGEVELARRELEPLLGGAGIDLSATQSLPSPNHRRANVSAGLAEVELAEGDIDTGLRRFRQTLVLMAWPSGAAAPGPADVLVAAAVVGAHVLCGHTDEVREVFGELVGLANERLGQFWDLPQIGSVANAVGSYLIATDADIEIGLELLVLSPRVFARQDYPSMNWRRHVDLHRESVGAERMNAALATAASRNRRSAAERILLLIDRLAGND